MSVSYTHLDVYKRQTVLSPAASPVAKALDPTAAHAGTVAGTRPRHAWVDVARGLVVTMVVVMHVGIYHYCLLYTSRCV